MLPRCRLCRWSLPPSIMLKSYTRGSYTMVLAASSAAPVELYNGTRCKLVSCTRLRRCTRLRHDVPPRSDMRNVKQRTAVVAVRVPVRGRCSIVCFARRTGYYQILQTTKVTSANSQRCCRCTPLDVDPIAITPPLCDLIYCT